jgi:hypothetical protein
VLGVPSARGLAQAQGQALVEAEVAAVPSLAAWADPLQALASAWASGWAASQAAC